MHAFEDLMTALKESNRPYDFDKITEAYQYASKAHEGQMRQSGDPYITHPIAVAQILVELVKMGTQATVLSVNKDGSLQLQAGILKITARQSEVRVVEGEAQKTQKEAQRFVQQMKDDINRESELAELKKIVGIIAFFF